MDITERKRSTQKLKDSEEKYRIAYEHENFYKDLFAHDIKNILQGVLSSLELYKLKMKSINEEIKNQNLLNDIENQISRGSNLIKNVRKFSKFDKFNIKLGNVDLMKIIKDIYEQLVHLQLVLLYLSMTQLSLLKHDLVIHQNILEESVLPQQNTH